MPNNNNPMAIPTSSIPVWAQMPRQMMTTIAMTAPMMTSIAPQDRSNLNGLEVNGLDLARWGPMEEALRGLIQEMAATSRMTPINVGRKLDDLLAHTKKKEMAKMTYEVIKLSNAARRAVAKDREDRLRRANLLVEPPVEKR